MILGSKFPTRNAHPPVTCGFGVFCFFNPFVILGAVVTLLALWVSKHFAASRLLLGGTHLVTDVFCHIAVFSSFCAFACLFLGGGCAYSFRAHLCSPLSIRLQCSDDSSLHTSHYPFISLTKRGLLKECCWANGMMVLVI